MNKNGIKGITYDAPGERDGRCYVVFDDKAIEILKKFSNRGKVDTTIKNFVDSQDLNSFQRAFATFAKEMGVPIVFFRGAKNFHGAHANGISFYNINAKFSHEWVYWHEFGHWLKNNQPALFNQLLDAAGITDEQVAEKRKSRPGLSDEELREEIICDAMGDVARRAGIFQQFAKKNQSLIQRLMSWAKSTLDKFTDWFHTRERGLTTAQRAKMYEAFGKIVRQIEDADGNKIFRYNSRTHEVELADGRKLPTVDTHSKPKYSTETETKKAAVTVTGDEFGEYTDIKDLRKKAIQYYKEHLQGTSVENKTLGKIDIDENGLVEFTSAGRKKVESTSAQAQKLLLVKHLPQLIRDATEIQKADPLKERHKDDIFYHMENIATIDGKSVPVHITLVKHNTGRIQFYNHTVEMENAPVNSAEPVSSKEALGLPPVGASSEKTISQEERDGKVKYSLDASDEEYLQAVDDFRKAKTDEQQRSTFRKLTDMVERAAEAAGFTNAIPEQTVAYKVRTGAAPKKTIKVYKVFTVANDGSPTALFVGGTEKLPQGVWLDAQDAYHFKAKNGKFYVPGTQNPYTKGGKTGASVEIPDEATRQELIERGFLPKGSKATKVTALAYRPGWHAGTLPFFPQGGMKRAGSNYENVHRRNQVVFECELAAEKNYTSEAEAQPKARNKDGTLNTRNADLQRMPENGFYYYATNPLTHGNPKLGMWAISGSLKINRALTQEECDKILADNGKLPQEWEQGELNLADLGYTGEQNDAARKTLAPITYDDEGEIIPLSQRFDASRNDIRYSLDASDERGFFDRTWDKFAKALHLKGDKIVTEEDQRKAHRAAQERAMEAYIKEPGEENRQKLADLHVTKGQLEAYRKGEEYENELSLRQYTVASPSRIADKVMVFRAFYRMGERAMDKLVQLRGKYERKYNGVMELVGNEQEREKLFELLWNGDLNHKEFGRLTDEEVAQIKAANPDETTAAIQRAKVEKICKEQNVSANVAQAYLQTRRLITAAYHMINEARRHPRTLTKHFSDSAIDELKANKFVEVKHISDERDSSGRRRVTYKFYEHVQRSFVATPADLARFETDDAIQIVDEQSLDDGNFLVEIREGFPDVKKSTGYIPHFFHTYVAVVKDAHGKQVGDILFTGKTERDAIKLAEQWQKTHTLKDGEQIYISPRGLDEELGMDAEKLAPIMGDKDLVKMLTRLAEKYDVTLDQARQIMSGTVRQKNRHRFLGNLLERKGAKGFVEDMDWILRHYFRIATRYAALESEFKPHAISLFERVFGAFDNDYSKNPLANYTKQYIEDVNGNPTTTELILNRMLNKTKAFRLFITPAYGDRGVLTLTNGLTRATAYLKLGFLNVSSAMLNLTQLINAAGKLGGWQVLSKHVGKLLSRGGKLTQSELRILAESGVLNDIGLDTSTGYDRNRASLFGGAGILGKLDNLGNKSMWLFQKLDSLCRASSALAAYEKAVAEGKSRAQALDYAKKVNLDANFSYGVEDAPNMFRRSGPIGKVLFQFMKYPVKELEIVAEMLPTSKRTTFAQKAAFWFPYLLACGLSGFFPFFDWGDEFLNKNFKLFPKDFMQKVIIKGSQEVFGADSELGRKVAQSLMYGIGAVANVDVSKRAGMASIMPRDLQSFLLGAAGSTLWGTTSNLAQGNYENALRSFSPGLFNIYAAAQGETHTSRDRKSAGYDAWGRAVRLMGFKSVDESFAADAYRIYHNEQNEHTKAEQRAIDAYIADPSPENRKHLQELKIKPERVKTERRKKNLDRMERLQQTVPKKRRKDYEYLFKFAQ